MIAMKEKQDNSTEELISEQQIPFSELMLNKGMDLYTQQYSAETNYLNDPSSENREQFEASKMRSSRFLTLSKVAYENPGNEGLQNAIVQILNNDLDLPVENDSPDDSLL